MARNRKAPEEISTWSDLLAAEPVDWSYMLARMSYRSLGNLYGEALDSREIFASGQINPLHDSLTEEILVAMSDANHGN